MDNFTNLSTELGLALKKRGYMLALAESCTGGLASAAITNTAGSSAWFDRGFITYSNASKQEVLAVSAKTLEQYGAVSEQTAIEMAIGALKYSHTQIAGSITGIAGPSGGTAKKPVGTVCFAWAIKDGHSASNTAHFSGSRQEIRHQAVIKLMVGLMDIIKQV
ncbi:MAG: CinA family protein [Methylophilaceae bacterium]